MAAKKEIKHTVVKGDTLWDLAKKYLGKGTRWREIYNLNKSKIKDPHWIYPGQVFLIQKGEEAVKVATPPKQETPKPATSKKDPLEITYENRFNKTKELDNLQHDPDQMKVINFKQDYTVLVRKKLYYAYNQADNEKYVKVFQINNFMEIRTSSSVYNRGSASIVMKGGERVVVATKEDVGNRDWNNFEELLAGWNSIEHENHGEAWNGVEYNSTMKIREYKYGWAIAEKCDIEPMDEVYIFSKSRKNKNKNGIYKFHQIFFGYITSVNKQYTAGQGGATISIQVDDHLKLLEISRMANIPAFDMRTVAPGSRLDGNGFWVVEDDILYNGLDPDTLQPVSSGITMAVNNTFAGLRAHKIIQRLCIEAGIPRNKITQRIEETERIPFAIKERGGNFSDLFSGDFEKRLTYAQKAAAILNFEFFSDEEGNIVFKIPTWNIGVNRKPKNNCQHDITYLYTVGGALYREPQKTQYEEKKVTKTKTVTKTVTTDVYHTVVKGDTLWDIAYKYLGKATRWPEIYQLNKSKIRDPHWIYPGQKFLIRKSQTKQVQEQYVETIKVEKKAEPVTNTNSPSISGITDNLIPVVYPWEITSFTFTDSDRGVYTAAQVTADTPYINMVSSGVTMAVQRAVQDPGLLMRFGYREFPAVTTPLVGGYKGAEIYANLLIIRSIANRYTGSLQMIEEASIKVGDPIRFNVYDEIPFREQYARDPNNMNSEKNAQAVFYVHQIDRSISSNGVSTMTLSLEAGRMMGMPSIYDKATELYRPFYEADADLPQTPEDPKPKTATKTHKVVKGESLWTISKKYYGTSARWNDIYEANRSDMKRGVISNPNKIYPGQVLKIP